MTKIQKTEKGPLSHWKIKCFWIMFNFWWSAEQSKQKCWAKCKKWKRPPKSSKNKIFIFGLCSTSDDRPSNLNKKHWPKRKKNEKGPLSHQKIKCSFLDYIQLLMISWVISTENIDRNAKKWKRPPKSLKIKCSFFNYIQLLMIGRAIRE